MKMKKLLAVMLVVILAVSYLPATAMLSGQDEVPGPIDVLASAAIVVENAIAAWDDDHDWRVGTVAVNQNALLAVVREALEDEFAGVTAAWVANPVRINANIRFPAHFAGWLRLSFEGNTRDVLVYSERPPLAWEAPQWWLDRNRIPDTGPRSALEQNIYDLVVNFGPRLWGSPNVRNARTYVYEQLRAAGDNWDVRYLTQPRTGNSFVGRIAFGNNLPDVYGNLPPASNAQWDAITGAQLVDLGTYPNLSVPQDVTGPIVGAVRIHGPSFQTGATAFDARRLITAFNALDTQAEAAGFLLAGYGAHNVDNLVIANTRLSNTAAISQPIITTTGYFLEIAVGRAEFFQVMERYNRVNNYSVVATRAPIGNPDLIIVVSSHLDSLMSSPGASDNASGIAVLLETARRFADVDLGNVKLILVGGDGHEGGGMPSSHYMANALQASGQNAVAINFNVDMVGTPGPRASGIPMNAVSLDIPGVGTGNETNLANAGIPLPAHLVIDTADPSMFAPGIENIRAFGWGSSDHVQFHNRGIPAASMILVCNCCNDLEIGYHNSMDNLEYNYCYDRLRMNATLLGNAIERAIEDRVTRRARFYVDVENGELILLNSAQIFRTFDRVTGTKTVDGTSIPFAFTYTGYNAIPLPEGAQEVTFGLVRAYGYGVHDHLSDARRERHARFNTVMRAEVVEFVVLGGEKTTMVEVIPTANASNFISIRETARASRVWAVTFDVKGLNIYGNVVIYRHTAFIPGPNANLSGVYTHADDVLAVSFDIRNNGANIVTFRIMPR